MSILYLPYKLVGFDFFENYRPFIVPGFVRDIKEMCSSSDIDVGHTVYYLFIFPIISSTYLG